MPHTRILSEPWFESSAIRPCTVRDFMDLVRIEKLATGTCYGIAKKREVTVIRPGFEGQANLFAEQAVFEVLRPRKRRSR